MNQELLKQASFFVALVGVAATVVIGLGVLILPETSIGGRTGGAADPGDDSFHGAVLTARGRPVDEGIILPRYEMVQGGVETGAVWDAQANFTTGFGESIRFRWSWVDDVEGGETEDVWALFSLREGSFTAEEGECHLDIDRYEPYEETFTVEFEDGTEHEFTQSGTEIAGTLVCEEVPSRRIGEPLSFEAVFRTPRGHATFPN